MKTKYFFTAIITLISAQSLQAADFFVYAEGGRGSSELSTTYSVGTTKSSEKNTQFSGGGGIVFESQFVIGAEYSEMATDNLLGADDRYDLDQVKFFGGYRIDLAKHFRLTPIVGTTRWELQTKSGALFGSPTPKTGIYRGNAIYGQLNLEFPINHLVTVITSLNQTEYDFGSAKSIQAGVMFQF